MKETYYEYKKRVNQLVYNRACFPPEWEYLCTTSGLSSKFNEYGHFKQFYGDTTVFPIPSKVVSELVEFQEDLYTCAEYMLSEKLPPETFHITLHDLAAGETEEIIEDEVESHKKVTPVLMDSVREKGKIHLKSVGIVSMVASSLVILFEPTSDTDHNTIQRVYNIFDTVRPLSYPLTLHCTLAYYKPGNYSPEQWNGLMRTVMELNKKKPIEIELDCFSLKYQYFCSMKEYNNLIG